MVQGAGRPPDALPPLALNTHLDAIANELRELRKLVEQLPTTIRWAMLRKID